MFLRSRVAGSPAAQNPPPVAMVVAQVGMGFGVHVKHVGRGWTQAGLVGISTLTRDFLVSLASMALYSRVKAPPFLGRDVDMWLVRTLYH